MWVQNLQNRLSLRLLLPPSSLVKPGVLAPQQGERVFPKTLAGHGPSYHNASAFEKPAWKSCLPAVFWL